MSDYPYSMPSRSMADVWAQRNLGRASPSPSGPGRSANGKGVWRRCNGFLYFKRIQDAQACFEAEGYRDENYPFGLFIPIERVPEAKAYAKEHYGPQTTNKRPGRWYAEKMLFYFSHKDLVFDFKMRFR